MSDCPYTSYDSEEFDEYETMREEVEEEFWISTWDLGDDDIELLHESI